MESMTYGLFFVGAIFFAYRAIVSKRILPATIYLAAISALVSCVLYLLGAAQVAGMELSVGAGLVTVLLVYAVSVVGDDAMDPPSVVPKPLAFAIVGLIAVLLGWMAYPAMPAYFEHGSLSLAVSLWLTAKGVIKAGLLAAQPRLSLTLELCRLAGIENHDPLAAFEGLLGVDGPTYVEGQTRADTFTVETHYNLDRDIGSTLSS